MVRDRLQELFQRDKADSNNATISAHRDGSMEQDQGKDVIIEMGCIDTDIKRFLTHVESVREEILEATRNVDKIKYLQGGLLDSPNKDEEKEKELDQLMAAVKNMSTDLMAKLKEMEQSNIETLNRNDKSEATLTRIQTVQHRALVKSFKNMLDYYQDVQRDHQEKCKSRVKAMLIIRNGGSDEQIDAISEDILDNGGLGMSTLSVFTDGYEEKTEEARNDLASADARLGHLLKIETALRELHDLFIEMARLVELQGEQLDNIEKNVAEAYGEVEAARGQLANAQKLQTSARKKKIIIIIVVILIILILGLIIYFSI